MTLTPQQVRANKARIADLVELRDAMLSRVASADAEIRQLEAKITESHPRKPAILACPAWPQPGRRCDRCGLHHKDESDSAGLEWATP